MMRISDTKVRISFALKTAIGRLNVVISQNGKNKKTDFGNLGETWGTLENLREPWETLETLVTLLLMQQRR